MGWYGLDSSGSAKGPEVCSCEDGSERSVSIDLKKKNLD